MTRLELDYFPPNGTKYRWGSPVLRSRPWVYNYDLRWPRDCVLRVYRTQQGYYGTADLIQLDGARKSKKTRLLKTPLGALLATERLGDAMLAAENLPAWSDQALKLGWRPPAQGARA